MKADPVSNTVMPPKRTYARARSRAMYNKLFAPRDNARLHETKDVPPDPDERHWWTVLDLDPNSSRLYLTPGFRLANRLGFVQTEHAWGGNPEDHPAYVY